MNIPPHIRPYQGAMHRPLAWDGGEPAALLVHGFLSSPAEMRPLAWSLHRAGWTVRAPLLAGHGPDIFSLPERHGEEWVEAVRVELASLWREHAPVLLVGHSLGGAVAVHAAASSQVGGSGRDALRSPFDKPFASLEGDLRLGANGGGERRRDGEEGLGARGPGRRGVVPDGLVLLAPYWLFGSYVHHLAWPLTRMAAGWMRPLRKVDFGDPVWRRRLVRILPDVDLDDPAVQQALRELRVPVRLLDELRALGTGTLRMAGSVPSRALVVQGTDDRLVKGHATRRLARRLPRLAGYAEVSASHGLINPEAEAWPEVESAVLRFAESLLAARAATP